MYTSGPTQGNTETLVVGPIHASEWRIESGVASPLGTISLSSLSAVNYQGLVPNTTLAEVSIASNIVKEMSILLA